MKLSPDFFHENKEMSILLAGSLVAATALLGYKSTSQDTNSESSRTGVMMEKDLKNANAEKNILDAPETMLVNMPIEKLAPSTKESFSLPKQKSYAQAPKGDFVFSQFAVPDEGVIIERKTFGDDKESVVYILDYHNNNELVSDFQRSVQAEIFGFVAKLADTYERVPVAMEVWTIGDTADNYVFRTSDSAMLAQLYSRTNRESRLEMVPAVMKNTKFAGPVIAGVFRDEVIPVGTVTETERLDANDLVRTDRRLRNAITGGRSFCTGTDGRNYTFYQARDAFRAGGSEVTDHCYCAVSAFEGRFLDRFGARMEEAPVKEVQLAIEAPGNLSVVIAGLKHWPAAREELERRGVNYVAVAAKSLADRVKEPPQAEQIEAYYPDSPDGKCERLMRERRELVVAAMGRI